MAIDTRSRRASVLGLGLVAALTLPLADGVIGQPDRQHVAFCYPGIAATVAVVSAAPVGTTQVRSVLARAVLTATVRAARSSATRATGAAQARTVTSTTRRGVDV